MSLAPKLLTKLPNVSFTSRLELLTYAEVIVNAALGGGKGISPGEVVQIGGNQVVAECFLPYLTIAVLKAGGHPVIDIKYESVPGLGTPTLIGILGTESQIHYVDTKPADAQHAAIHHDLWIKAPLHVGVPNPFASEAGVVARSKATKILSDHERKFRENKWLSNSLVYFPTEALAREANCSIEELWSMISDGCQLKAKDPIKAVRGGLEGSRKICEWLDGLKCRTLKIKGENVDLTLDLHAGAIWRGGTGANLPSFECFTTPMASSTNGWVKFAHPIVYEGYEIKGLHVSFEGGRIKDWKVSSGQEGMEALLKHENADRLGEVAFTDKRLSNIKVVIPHMPMCIENLPGTGHVALGCGYQKCLTVPGAEADMNDAKPHKDGVIDGDFTVTAITASGEEIKIFADGEYTCSLA